VSGSASCCAVSCRVVSGQWEPGAARAWRGMDGGVRRRTPSRLWEERAQVGRASEALSYIEGGQERGRGEQCLGKGRRGFGQDGVCCLLFQQLASPGLASNHGPPSVPRWSTTPD
jgi:hypothetical protein